HIGVGLARREPCDGKSFRTFPGWNGDWAYHGDDGNKYDGTGRGEKYGPRYTKGDRIGCGVDFRDRTIYYTKHGKFLGKQCPSYSSAYYRELMRCRSCPQ